MIIELPPPPSKIAWGPVFWMVSVIALILWKSYVPGEGINVGTLLIYIMAILFVPTAGYLAFPLAVLALGLALYDKVMFWFSLRRASRPNHPISFPAKVSTFQAPSPADVPPPVRRFQGESMRPIHQPIEI